MNFNLVEMYNGLLRFNKHILNELAEGLKHLPNLDGVSWVRLDSGAHIGFFTTVKLD